MDYSEGPVLLFIVAQETIPVGALLHDGGFAAVDVLADDGRFLVWRARAHGDGRARPSAASGRAAKRKCAPPEDAAGAKRRSAKRAKQPS